MLRVGVAEVGADEHARDAFALESVSDSETPDASHQALTRNELLFEAGDLKSKVYRVESGALCIYRTRPDLTVEIIEHALAGDLVGLGYLDRHSVNARATVETKVSAFNLGAVDWLIGSDAHNKARYHDAVEREFLFRRENLASSARERPLVRLAAFLVAVSDRSAQEGGDPTFIDDSVDCGVIADFLGLSLDLLALALMQLEMRGLVEAAPRHGLRLKDISALEAIAAEQDNVPSEWASFPEFELRPALQ